MMSLNGKKNGIMKKNFMMIALASVLMMPVSCTKNEMDAPQSAPSYDFDLKEMTVSAVPEDGITKTSINLEDGVVSWTAGDAIKLAWELGKEVGYSTSATLKADDIVEGVASFVVSAPSDFDNETSGAASRHMYAIYPSTVDVDYSTASSLYVTVPDVQDGTFANASISLAKWYYGKPFAFKNLCGLVQVVVEDDAVRKIVLEANTDIAGKVDVGGFDGGVVNVKSVKEGKKTIAVNVGGAGTYYIAVLPGTLENVYVALYDDKDELIGDRIANNDIPVARKQLRKLGALATGFSDRYYVKVDGTGDGSSWDNAANVSGMLSIMQSTTAVVTKKIYVAKGEYTIADKSLKPKAGSSIKVYGGFSAEATGYSISGRDVENNKSQLQNLNGRTCYTQAGSWEFDGLYFKSQGYKNEALGCALLLLSGTESAQLNNCHFEGSEHGYTAKTTGGAIVRLAVEATFNNCVFKNNTSGSVCGGIYVTDTGVLNANDCVFDSNVASNSGGAIYVKGNGVVKAKDCIFRSNQTSINGGAIYFDGVASTSSEITNCSFIENQAKGTSANTGLGGSVGSAGSPSSIGIASFTNCMFSGNVAGYGGGAIWSRALNYRFEGCNFINNAASGSGGDALLMDGDKLISMYCNSCYFGYTSAVNKTSLITDINTNSSTSLGIANSVLTGDWGKAARMVRITSNGTIANTTVIGQQSNRLVQITGGTCNVINSILANAGSSGTKGEFDNSATLNVDYSLYHMINTGANATTTVENSVAGIKVQSAAVKNFPVNTTWYAGSADQMYTSNQTSTMAVNDCRGNIYFYAWDGTYPEETTYTLASLETVKSLVKSASGGFSEWLGDKLGKDIRGNARNTAAMWPGSYEDAAVASNAENLNVR